MGTYRLISAYFLYVNGILFFFVQIKILRCIRIVTSFKPQTVESFTMSYPDKAFEASVQFIKSLGINVHFKTLDPAQILPGISIEQGAIFIEEKQLLFPGDVLHEAGHIAVVPLAERHTLNKETIGKRTDAPAEEMMAIAWSYAACIHLQLPPEFVFHENGYKGGGSSICENFKNGQYFGVPMLQYRGMCCATPNNHQNPYPVMINWTMP